MNKSYHRGAYLDDENVWVQVLTDTPDAFQGRPALFLDRDGALIEEKHYLSDPDEVTVERGAADLICACNRAAIAVIIVTNQAGIARGYYDWNAFEAVQERLLADLNAVGARTDAVFACGHHKDGIAPYQHDDHPARKPNPGMIERAREALGVDLGASWVIGDRGADIEAGRNAGLKGGLHVLTGHGADDGERGKAEAQAVDGFQVLGADGIWDALGILPFLKD